MKSTWEVSVRYHTGTAEQKKVDYGEYPNYTAVIVAETVPEALNKVWTDISSKEQKNHLEAVAKAKADNVFPPDAPTIHIDTLQIRRAQVNIIE